MDVIRLTKIFHFDMAHVLKDYDGPCRNIHGHSYELRVTVEGVPVMDATNPKNGMAMDFGLLKRIVNEQIVDKLDHAFVIPDSLPEDFKQIVCRDFEKVVVVSYQPTSEMMLIDFAARLRKALPDSVRLHSILLQETPGSYAEWVAE